MLLTLLIWVLLSKHLLEDLYAEEVLRGDCVNGPQSGCKVTLETPNETSVTGRSNLPLEFVHIPKTGGSAIEKAAARVGISWGACHFHHDLEKEMNCPKPDLNASNITKMLPFRREPVLWHIPPNYWKPNPFETVKTFAVVRNPFTRTLSAYHCPIDGYTEKDRDDPEVMNSVIKYYITRKGHWYTRYMPQSSFVFDLVWEKKIDHVLKYENLTAEFRELMETYNLTDVVLEEEQRYNTPRNRTLTLRDLTNETIELIREHFREDFIRLGYPLTLPLD